MKRSQERARRWVLRELGRTLARRNSRPEAAFAVGELGKSAEEPAPAEIGLPERMAKLILTGVALGAFGPASFAAFMSAAAGRIAAAALTPGASLR